MAGRRGEMPAVGSRKSSLDFTGPVDARRSSNGRNGPFSKVMGVFKQFDANRDGTIDRQELRFLMSMLDSKWTDARSDAMFEAIDVNKDGKIQFEELLRWTFSGRIGGKEQPAFRELVDLDSEVRSLVVVEVRSADGEVVFGPEELLGSMTIAQLRRRVRSKADLPVGCLVQGESILRDSLELGVYAQGPCLDVTIVESVLSLVPKACMDELKELGVIDKIGGKRCIRLGVSEPADGAETLLRKGENDREFVLMEDGRLMAKEVRFRWHRYLSTGKMARRWHYGIAEGTFSLLDPESCHVEVNWRGWAEATGEDEEGNLSVDEAMQPWKARMMDLDRPPEPLHLLPSSSNQINVLFAARDWAQPEKENTGLNAMSDPRDGIAIPALDEGGLDELDMDASNLTYWQHGRLLG